MSMSNYRFVALNAETYIGGVKLTKFGQCFKIDDKLAEDAQRGGAALLEESEFLAFGFTPAEVKAWSSPFLSQHDVPADPDEAEEKAAFLAKVHMAQARYIEIQQGLLQPHERTLVSTAGAVPSIIPQQNEIELEA